MRFNFIQQHQEIYPVELLCQSLHVTRGGFYGWQDRPVSARHKRQEQLTGEIRQAHEQSRRIYGSPRVHQELVSRGVACY